MQNKALLSLGQFCDNDYVIELTKTEIFIKHLHDPTMSLHGHRDTTTGMWTVNLGYQSLQPQTTSNPLQANNVYELHKKRDIVTYLHKAAFSPVPSTWIQAIETGFYTTWPGLTADLVRKHLPKSEATVKGHLKQIRQNLRSTKRTPPPKPNPNSVMTTGTPSEPVRANKLVTFKIIELEGKVFSDQTGRFPITSSRGNKYIMVMFVEDANAILAEPLKSRAERDIVNAMIKLHTYLTDRGFTPQTQILDNECPGALKQHFKSSNIDF